MGCFSCFEDDPSEDDLKNATKISLYSEEDRLARQRIEKEKEEIEMERAKKESLKQAEEDEAKRILLKKSKEKGKGKQVDDDHVEGKRQIKASKDMNPPPPSICNGCKSEIGDGVSQCSCCLHCHKPIAMHETAKKGNFHRNCYKEHRNPNCYVCENKIPSTKEGKKFHAHPFWKEKYCPCHDDDGTAKCCSCERLESSGTKYVMLADGRWLCRECLECAVMDTVECHQLHMEIRDFLADSRQMKFEKEFPVLLVEKEALNKAEKEEKIDNNYGMVTRGICLSEEQMVKSVTKWRIGPNKQLIEDMDWNSQMVERKCKCEVTAILILYGLPRLLTGYILAHEMMHAWLRLKGYKNLDTVLEEGLCQVLGHMWLEPQTYATTDVASSASSSSRTPPAKKGDPSAFEKELVKFCKKQIETDNSPVYGVGFKRVSKMMESNGYNLQDTLKDIVSASKTLPDSKF